MRNRLMASAAILAVSACSNNQFPGAGGGNLDDSGLQQVVSVSTASPAVGDSIKVRSVIVNTGTAAASVTVGCAHGLTFSGLGFATQLDTLPTAGCTASLQIAPGDSLVTSATTPPVTASPGVYDLSVQQVLSPHWAVRVAVQVK
jgi:hypothetical protein